MALRKAAFDAAAAASRFATSSSVAVAEVERKRLAEFDAEEVTPDGGTNPMMAGSWPPIDIIELLSMGPRW